VRLKGGEAMAGKVVSTQVVRCRECSTDDRVHEAVLIVYEDGYVEVRCDGGCTRCRYTEPARG